MISCSSGEMGFFEKVWQQNKLVVIIAVILIILIVVVLKISLFPSAAAEEPALAPEKEPETAAPPEDKTKAAEEEATVMEGEIAGSLTVIVKDEEIGTFDITPTPIIVGRDPRSDVVIKSETISKSHLKIIPKGDQFFVVDLGSTNGTYVNREKITETLVTPEDMVQLGKRGNIKLIFKK
jgi:pSer/pThr/pTyr-binding forkhead associated (FHA) protein